MHARAVSRRVRRRRLTVVVGLAVVVTLVVVFAVTGAGSPGGTGPATTRAGTGGARDGSSTTTASRRHRKGGKGVVEARTFLDSHGVRSTAIIAENREPGTAAWQITSEPPTGMIEGFADLNYAQVGQKVTLYVSTDAPRFKVVAYRMGYYQGLGGHQVWSSSETAGKVQPACPVTALVNMVSCDNWTPSLTFPVTAAFTSGDYLLKLVASTGPQAYVLLTVWDPTSTAAYLIMNRSLVEQGWNAYGGYSYYQGQGPCLLDPTPYPVCNRARIVSFDRPYDTGDGASDFLSNEYPLIRYAEQNGLDVTYATDITVDEHPTMLLAHRALISLGHDETWTYPEREAAQTALAHGVNIAFMGAASLVRHARLQPSPLGPDREEVDYRNELEDPLNGKGDPMDVTGNTWSSPPTSWPAEPFVGQEYSGYLEPNTPAAPFVVFDASAWIFKGTGLHDGSAIPGAIDSDIDHVDPAAEPADEQVLGHSPIPLSEAYTNQGTWGGYTYSDMTYYTDPTSQGGVFDSGDNNWINAMAPCAPSTTCTAPLIQQITGNLLWLFGQGPAGRIVPAVSNTASVTPTGS